jgi:GxxExxY protein
MGTNRRPCEHPPSVFPVVLRPSSVRIKNATVRTIARCVATQQQAALCASPLRGPCVNNLFLIRTEEERRTTGNTESRMLLAESLTEQVIGLAIEMHRNTGPGLLEAVYEQCLCVERRRAGVAFARQVSIPMLYKVAQIGDGFKADVVVAEQLILEIKSAVTILTVHEMQLRTYLRMSGIRVGLLLNFNAPRLMDGLRRYVV